MRLCWERPGVITDEMAALFAKYKFLLGVSLDGPPGIHDQYRRTKQGNGSHQAVLSGIERLKQHQVEFNVLVLVSSANVGDAAIIYHYLSLNQVPVLYGLYQYLLRAHTAAFEVLTESYLAERFGGAPRHRDLSAWRALRHHLRS